MWAKKASALNSAERNVVKQQEDLSLLIKTLKEKKKS